MEAIVVSDHGGPDVMSVQQRDRPEPGPGEIRINVEAAGVNFADIQQRQGQYPGGPAPPFIPGMEVAGTVAAVGENAAYETGQRVVAMANGGGYAEAVVVDTDAVLPLPAEVSFLAGAGFPVQFLTAHNALFDWGRLETAERVLIHAAAGGVGTAAVQLAASVGAEVFGTASTPEKLDRAVELGVDHPINYAEQSFSDVIAGKTDNAGVDLVLDGVGGAVFDESIDALAHFGRLVTIGVASGNPPVAPATKLLMENKRVIGFHLGHAMARDHHRILDSIPELTNKLLDGKIEVVIGQSFPLAAAGEAHSHIEARENIGKVVLEV